MADTYDVAQAWLRWFHAHGYDPNPEEYLNEPRYVGGEQVSTEDLKPAVRLVHSSRLISGSWPRDSDFPLRPSMTQEGELMMIEYGGNVRAWREGQRPALTTYTDSRSYSLGNFANLAADSPGATQTVTSGDVNLDQAEHAAKAAGELAELPRVPDDSKAQLQVLHDEILAELANETPDHGRVRVALQRLAATVVPLASTSTLAMNVAEVVHAAINT